MKPKEMASLHGILNKGFLESCWKETSPAEFEKSKEDFLEKMKDLGGRLGNNRDLPEDEKYALLSTGWAGNKVNVTVGHYVEFPEETARKILVLGLP